MTSVTVPWKRYHLVIGAASKWAAEIQREGWTFDAMPCFYVLTAPSLETPFIILLLFFEQKVKYLVEKHLTIGFTISVLCLVFALFFLYLLCLFGVCWCTHTVNNGKMHLKYLDVAYFGSPPQSNMSHHSSLSDHLMFIYLWHLPTFYFLFSVLPVYPRRARSGYGVHVGHVPHTLRPSKLHIFLNCR